MSAKDGRVRPLGVVAAVPGDLVRADGLVHPPLGAREGRVTLLDAADHVVPDSGRVLVFAMDGQVQRRRARGTPVHADGR